ncbi:hypothetical protein BDZ97DRAFT_1905766 [Flammula alnicola]|nr:hypothetical protein BDZ97DRAFT_1905766 [Flammula alnicola]
MGVTTSHVVVSDLLPSSYKDFSPPRVQTNTNVPNSAYNNANNGNQYQPQQQFPNRANSRSTSPPLPPGAALPANFHPFQVRSQDAPPPPRSRPLPSVHHTSRNNPPPLQPAEVSLRKSLSFQATIAPLKGKPRIFAAMEAQENELEKVPDIQPPPPPQPQLMPQRQRQHQRQDQQQPAPHHVITKRPPPNQQIQHQPHHQLLPSVELEFSTPMSRFDPLPNEFSNGNAFEADLRSSSTYKTPPTHQRPLPEQATHINRKPLSMHRALIVLGLYLIKMNLVSNCSRHKVHLVHGNSANRVPTRFLLSAYHPNASSTTLPGTPSLITRSINTAGIVPLPNLTPSTPPPSLEPVVQLDEDTIRNAGIPLDDDPFARVEGVTLLKPTTPPPAKEGSIKRQRAKGSLKVNGSRDDVAQVAEPQKQNGAPTPLTPVSPEDYRQWRKERKHRKSGTVPPPPVVDMVVQNIPPRDPFTLAMFVSDPQLLSSLLAFLTFYDWCVLSAVSKEIRVLLVRTPVLREAVLEAYLKPLDLSDYMRGVSTPTHEYARVAAMHVHSLKIHPNHRDPSLAETVRSLTASTRAYTRVVLRLRAQAEKEAAIHAATTTSSHPPPSSVGKAAGSYSPARGATPSRVSSRAPSPTTSMYSYTQHNSSHPHPPGSIQQTSSQTSLTFRSPLFRLRRAPLLRVFVPSPEGDWLSDKSVVECEAECKRDVVWDVAVGDEGNVGRLVWDGSYLLDLDYTYSTIGDLPKYLPTLTFPPSYFHRVIRTGANATNPIVHIDISPWGEEIALNLQLLQDRVRTETPQGAYHNVVRWVHRSSFSIRAPRSPPRYNNSARPSNGRIPIPDSNNLFVDHGWYGTVVVETEGTNEALADLQDRCGPGAFPPRSRAVSGHITQAQIENRKVFRILRERSRPSEIWIKAVGVKERLL